MYLLHESTQLKYFRNNVVVQVHTQKTLMLLLVTPPQHSQSQTSACGHFAFARAPCPRANQLVTQTAGAQQNPP